MNEVNGFNFSQYDAGGTGATANDGRLTGEEVEKARADGWNVWEEFRANDEASKIDKSSSEGPNHIKNWFQLNDSLAKSETYKAYKQKYNEILEIKLAKYGITPDIDKNGDKVFNIGTMLFDPDYKKACAEAEKEAKELLGLSENAFSYGALDKLKAFFNEKLGLKNDEAQKQPETQEEQEKSPLFKDYFKS